MLRDCSVESVCQLMPSDGTGWTQTRANHGNMHQGNVFLDISGNQAENPLQKLIIFVDTVLPARDTMFAANKVHS